ncbi:MAG: mannose-1-phosphate guanylyltransferase [Cellulomonadaceae bacterium]
MVHRSEGKVPDFYAVIPAGGAGTRLWPLSRAVRPKFLLDLTGAGRSLLQATVDRLAPVAAAGHTMVVTGAKHVAAVREQLPDVGAQDVLAEPSGRDSMAAIGLAAAVLRERHGDVVLGSFAADQVITSSRSFERAVREGITAARAGYVVTIGIAASRPSTAFGYVRSGEELGLPGAPSVRTVLGFTEKPDADTARTYLATGEYRWNAGMFLTRASVLLEHLERERPQLCEGLVAIARAWDTPARDEVRDAIWPTLERVPIDTAIAEPVAARGGVAMVPGDFGWDDVGDFNSLAALLPAVDDRGSKVLGDAERVVRLDSAGSVIVPGTDRVVAVLGLDDVVVVDTPGALLVTTRARAQQVKAVVDAVQERGRDDLL